MKRVYSIWCACIVGVIVSCGINQQAKQIQALEKCAFEVKELDSVYLAGLDVAGMLRSGSLNTRGISGIALGMLKKEVPLKGVLHLKITNPTSQLAGINQFQYQLLLKDQQLITGLVDRQVRVSPGESVEIPIPINANVYGLLSSSSALEELSDFISGQNPKQESLVTIKLKPTLALGNKVINYPGWITFDRKVTRDLLL